MATVSTNYARPTSEVATSNVDRVTNILHWTYGLVPIVAGADKFANILTDWSQYLSPVVSNIIPAETFMMIVGVIEIIAGIVVLVRPKLGSLIVALWLIAIAINLLLTGKYFDVAVRDAVMAIGAFSLYLLSPDNHHKP
ncbi:MAG TPA: tRNA (5-methylaminomethyl-2-thiouridylate)-methyltransferase [Chryseolinea sp.]|nr:tRNA (5-methylaminomethyl-2-thiouridylate)-methyltransferase [Chryseolinea sp.]